MKHLNYMTSLMSRFSEVAAHFLFGEEVVEHSQQLQHSLFSPRLCHVVVVDHQVRVDLNKMKYNSQSPSPYHTALTNDMR